MSQSDPSAHSRPSPSRPTPSRARGVGIAAGVLAAALVAAFLLASLAEAGGWFGGHGFGGRGHGFDRERAHDHAEFAVEWTLRHVDASDEQQARIQAIVSSTLEELSALREPHQQHRDAFVALLAQSQVDRAQLELLRSQELALADDASRVLTDALAEIADTLTVEQRAELLEHAARHRRGHGWH